MSINRFKKGFVVCGFAFSFLFTATSSSAQKNREPLLPKQSTALSPVAILTEHPAKAQNNAKEIFLSQKSKRALGEKHSPITPSIAWTQGIKTADDRVFIENKGQFNYVSGIDGKSVLYGLHDGITDYYFTRQGLSYRISKPYKPTEEEWKKYAQAQGIESDNKNEEREEKETRFIEKSEVVQMTWKNTGQHPEITAENKVENYFNYLFVEDPDHIIGRVRGYKSIVYRNIYPHIDVEYTIHPERGIKYAFILHPGADPSLIQMSYSGAEVRFDTNGDIRFPTPLGDITDQAPKSYLGSGNSSSASAALVTSAFRKISENTIGFKLGEKNAIVSETTTIDPWTAGPPVIINIAADDLAIDAANNIVVYEVDTTAGSKAHVTKWNAAGTQQWQLDVMTKYGYDYLYQGDILADPAGNIYFSMGCGARIPTAKFYNTIKVDPTGTTVWGSATPHGSSNNMYETWNLSFNCDYTQLVQSGGGIYTNPLADHNNAVWETVNTTSGVESAAYIYDNLGEILASTWGPSGLIYHLTADSTKNGAVSTGNYTTGSNNRLNAYNPATGFSVVFSVYTGYAYEDFDKKAPFSTGMNSIAANCAYVYTSDGKSLDQWDAKTGAHLHTATIPGGSNVINSSNLQAGGLVNSGLVIDKCGNVYAGGNKNVYVYDANLNLTSTIGGFPGIVYDLALGNNNNVLYVCGGNTLPSSFLAAANIGACTPPSTLSVAVTQPTCAVATGSATATATFCGAPYSYSWTGGATTQTINNLAPGTYTVIVKGSLICPYSLGDTAVITINPAPGISSGITPVNISCNPTCNGSATVSPSGGTGTYSYSWNNGAGNVSTAGSLCAGPISCTITDGNGCTVVKNITITQPAAPLSATQLQTNVNCFGSATGAASVSASGGTSAYAYNWTGGTITSGQGTNAASGLSTGTYTCTITDANSCSINKVFTITQPASTLSATQAQTNVNCFGSASATASVTASGGTSAYAYNWTGGAIGGGQGTSAVSGLASGTYTCTITDANTCSINKVFTITQPAAVLSAVPSQTNVACFGASTGAASVAVSGGTVLYTYSWTGGTIGSGQGTNAVTGLANGTYTCSVNDSKNCVTSSVITISQPAAALAISPAQTNVSCNASCDGTATATTSGGTGPYTYFWSGNGSISNVASALCPGNYTCSVTDNKGCPATKSFTITQPAALSISPVSSTNTSCTSATGTASVSVSGGNPAYTYSWNPVPGTGQGTASIGNLSALTYTLTLTDSKSCSKTYTVAIVASNAPIVSPGAIKNLTCNGICNGSAAVVASGGTGTLTYSWSPSGGNAATASNLCSGSYTCHILDQNGCPATQNITITQPAPVTASTSSTNATCNASNGTASASGSGGSGTFNYSWNSTNTIGAGQGTANISGLAAGTYTVTVSDGSGCTGKATVAVNNTGAPSLSSTQTNLVCSGACTGNITVNASGGAGSYVYSWAPASGIGNSISNLCVGIYTCYVRDASNCLVTRIDTIKAPPVLVINPSQVNISCNAACNGSASAVTSGGSGTYTYSWSGTAAVTAQATALCPGVYTCTVTDSLGCTASNNYTITQPAVLTAGGTQTNISCNGSCNGVASVSAGGGSSPYTYSWSGSAQSGTTLSALCPGQDTCFVSDSKGCTVMHSFTITQPASLGATGSVTSSSCQLKNGSANVSASGGSGGYTYSWSPKGGSGSTATALDSGIYICTIKDSLGCTAIVKDTIHNAGIAPKVQLSAGGPLAFCNGSNVVLNASGTANSTYSWSTGATGPSITVSTAGTYSCTLINSCGRDSANLVVTVNNPPNPLISGLNKFCAGSSGTLTASGGLTYSWNTGATTPSITVNTAGIYTVTATNACGSVSTTDTVQVSSVSAHFGSSATSGPPPLPVVFTDSSSGAITSWSWTFGDGTTATGVGANHTFNPAGTYTVILTVTNALGCTSSYSQVIQLKDDPSWIIIPNVFTPNGDGSNDFFQINSKGITSFNAKIFDRWGVKMSELTTAQQGWDGYTVGGLPAVPGTYYYILKAEGSDGQKYDLTGFLMLIRQ
jgi:gliding motility-associated-like protein